MQEQIQWRETGKYPLLFIVDARALYPLLLFLMHMREWTFHVSMAGVAIFWFLSMAGITPPVAMRLARTYIVGRHRPTPFRTSSLRKRMEFEKLESHK